MRFHYRKNNECIFSGMLDEKLLTSYRASSYGHRKDLLLE